MIPPFDSLSPFSFFSFSEVTALTCFVCQIMATKASTAPFSLAEFSSDCSWQATASFFYSTISKARQSNLASSTRSWYSSKDFRSILEPAPYNYLSSNSGPGAFTEALIDSTSCCPRNGGPKGWSAIAREHFNRLVWTASISVTSL